MILGTDMDGAEVGAGVGAEVLLETSLGVSSKGDVALALRKSTKAAGISEAEAESGCTDAAGAAVKAAAGAEAGAEKGAKANPVRRAAKLAETAMNV